jgi:hypothetical protein
MLPSSERSLVPYHQQNQLSGDSLQNQIQSIDHLNRGNTAGLSASAAQLGRDSRGNAGYGQYDPQQYAQNASNYYQMNEGANL